MKKKIFLDIIMFIVFIILMFLNFTGVLLHEILGIALFVLTLIHIYLNRKFLFGMKLSDANNKMKFKLILDWLMTTLLIALTITGVLISRYLFTFVYVNVNDLHNYLAVILLGIMLIHLALNLNLVYTVLKIKNKIPLVMISILGFVGLYSYIIYHNIFLINKKELETEEDANIEEESTVPSNQDTTPIETLAEYLKKLHCGGCGRNCSLFAPQCGIGESKAIKAKEDYNTKYNITATASSISYKSGDYEIVAKL